jgi:predicted  nucleic acid-binding Zn-ribbon protein
MAVKTPKKVTKEELDNLKTLQNKIDTLTVRFGSLQIAKIKVEKQESLLTEELFHLQKEETKIAEELTAKYGKGSLNTDTGEFTSTE